MCMHSPLPCSTVYPGGTLTHCSTACTGHPTPHWLQAPPLHYTMGSPKTMGSSVPWGRRRNQKHKGKPKDPSSCCSQSDRRSGDGWEPRGHRLTPCRPHAACGLLVGQPCYPVALSSQQKSPLLLFCFLSHYFSCFAPYFLILLARQ